MDWADIINTATGALLGGGGIFGIWLAKEAKKKTPYDMLVEMLQEQKRFYADRNAEYEAERRASQEKSKVINAARKCPYKYKDPNLECPVDKADEERLRSQCESCSYGNAMPVPDKLNN